MAEVLIVYARSDGPTHRVGERVARAVRATGHRATLARVDEASPLTGFDAVVVGAPIEAGRLGTTIIAFARAQAAALSRLPTGLFTVSLSSTPPDAAGREVMDDGLRRFQTDTGWRPDVIASFAGTLKYGRYSLLHRALARRGGQQGDNGAGVSDESAHVYADWDAIGGFVEAFLHHVRRATEPSSVSSTRPASA